MRPVALQDHAFTSQVDAWVAAGLAGGATDFGALLRALPGVYPTVAVASLRRLRDRGRASPALVAALECQAATGRPAAAPSPADDLPLPHPLNYEWRFATDSARRLLHLAEALSRPGDTVLLLGTPGVAALAAAEPVNRRLLFLGERNPVTEAVRTLSARAGGAVDVGTCGVGAIAPGLATVVAVDPPWYLDFVRPMLATAAAACRLGGYVLASLPPPGTRATAVEDSGKALRWAARSGLSPVGGEDGGLTYATPFFERNALAAAGVGNAPHDWRRGDLVILRKIRDHSVRAQTGASAKRRWREVAVGAMRLFVRVDQPLGPAADGELRPVAAGEVLPTVSRRDPRRRRAAVWTSGNRAFAAARPDLVLQAARATAAAEKSSGGSAAFSGSMAERDVVERLGHALRRIADVEAGEVRSLASRGDEAWSAGWGSTSAT